jgi:hypothetical protein
MKPHKHAELIKAWADGAIIQSRSLLSYPGDPSKWADDNDPRWISEYYEFRIKPEDIVTTTFCWFDKCPRITGWVGKGNLKLTFHSETGELKSAEVLK